MHTHTNTHLCRSKHGPISVSWTNIHVCCSVLRCIAVCCSVLQCVAVCCSALQCVAVCCSVLQCVTVCCSVLQCVAVCCSVMQCDVICFSNMFQFVADKYTNVHTNVCIRTFFVCVYIYTHSHINTHLCHSEHGEISGLRTNIHMYIRIYVYVYVCTYTQVYIHTCVCIHAYIYMYVCICIFCVYIYRLTHTNQHTPLPQRAW